MGTMPMQSMRDCGRVSASNHVSCMTGRNVQECYAETDRFGQPKFPLLTDFWDSPSRQIANLESITGQKAGLVPTNPLMVPCVCLVKQLGSWLYDHWITILSVDPSKGIYHWHDGKRERDDPLPWDIEMAIAVGGTGKLPWHWKLWGWATRPIRRLW